MSVKQMANQRNGFSLRFRKIHDSRPVKMMIEPRSICQMLGAQYTSPMPPNDVPSRSRNVGRIRIGCQIRACTPPISWAAGALPSWMFFCSFLRAL